MLGKILDPTATRISDDADPGPEAGALRGKRIGFRVDRMWRAWDYISEQWADKFKTEGASVSFWCSGGRSGTEGERQDAEYKAFVASIDVAIVGLANCGSCTGWTIRDAIVAANAGLPTVAIATKNFEDFAHELATRGGRSGLRVHVLPYPLNEQLRDDVLAVGEAHFETLLGTLGARMPIRERAA